MQLAQLNLARWTIDHESDQAQGFVGRLYEVNALGEQAAGFVWRLKDEAGNAMGFRLFDDPLLIVNLTVWESIDDLKRFAYTGTHQEVFRQRTEWFEKPSEPMTVLWWVSDGHEPDLQEAGDRLRHLRRHGPTDQAFTFARNFRASG